MANPVIIDAVRTPIGKRNGVLSGMQSLKRLNIARTQVKDLSPLEGLNLQRLIFTPSEITMGIDAVRSMTSLAEIGTSFETVMPAAQFWNAYDAGEFAAE